MHNSPMKVRVFQLTPGFLPTCLQTEVNPGSWGGGKHIINISSPPVMLAF